MGTQDHLSVRADVIVRKKNNQFYKHFTSKRKKFCGAKQPTSTWPYAVLSGGAAVPPGYGVAPAQYSAGPQFTGKGNEAHANYYPAPYSAGAPLCCFSVMSPSCFSQRNWKRHQSHSFGIQCPKVLFFLWKVNLQNRTLKEKLEFLVWRCSCRKFFGVSAQLQACSCKVTGHVSFLFFFLKFRGFFFAEPLQNMPQPPGYPTPMPASAPLAPGYSTPSAFTYSAYPAEPPPNYTKATAT